jgi:hypothetical protein
MTGGEKNLLRLIKNYRYNQMRLEETEEALRCKTYKITPSYGSTGGGGKSAHSKVESFVEKAVKLKRDAAEYRRKVKRAEAALNCPELTVMEQRVLYWIASGERLAGLAERDGIYISRVYKIRDKALRKALGNSKAQNEGISR